MENLEFYDEIYQQWSKTTGAEDRYYVVKPAIEYSSLFNVYAVNEDGDERRVAEYLKEQDADWFASVHGCFADLIRRLRELEDEVEQADVRADEQAGIAAVLAEENAELQREDSRWYSEVQGHLETIDALKHEIRSLEEELSYAMGEEE